MATKLLILHPLWNLLTYLFESFLIAAFLLWVIQFAVDLALIVAKLLGIARNLCIYCGKYFYKFPKGMQI